MADTKVQAIIEVLKENGGVASWRYIYDHIEKYYPAAKAAKDWDAGIRGVLYREIRNGKNFKKVGIGVYALLDYKEAVAVKKVTNTAVRKHSYVESLLVEIGNNEGFDTYCADPSAMYRPGVPVDELTTIKDFPIFTYQSIVDIAKRVDVIWFTKNGHQFPFKLIEVVDSISTLSSSLQRMYQLKDFQCDFRIVCPDEYVQKVHSTLTHEPYCQLQDRFSVKSYTEIEHYHEHLLRARSVGF